MRIPSYSYSNAYSNTQSSTYMVKWHISEIGIMVYSYVLSTKCAPVKIQVGYKGIHVF